MQIATDQIPIVDPPASRSRHPVLDRWLGCLLDSACVLLLSAEIVLLLVGVIARYVFQAPQVWIDEMTSLLFLWLSMLGAVLALRTGSHMRMTALINRTTGRAWEGLNALGAAAPILFLLFT
ncbi:MAG TPA: TRAP transporter small permease subunit, partial [Rhodopila sp.]|nr:TRAP transporter small permease subunit [Rhodopila sp.]